MAHSVFVRTENEACEMQFIQQFDPPVPAGRLRVAAQQQIMISGEEETHDQIDAEKEFQIAYRAFTVDPADVWSVSPSDQDTGKFANQLPHITLKNKTFPWLYETPGQEPWIALIAVTDEEQEEKDITIRELMEVGGEELYFPVEAQPAVYQEQAEDLCHVVDLKRDIFLHIAPRAGERSLLTHGKFLNLLDKSDDQVEMDGFFSCVIGGRFLPSGKGETIKSTIHLVSMLGYDDPEGIPDTYSKVRLVSLYHWDVFSQGDAGEGFTSLMQELDCDVIGIDSKNDLLACGYVPKCHLFRNGERTISLYRGPLIPFDNSASSPINSSTADGAMVFHKEMGVFDVSLSTAWQMGRLLTLQDKAISEALIKWRKEKEKSLRRKDASCFLRSLTKESEKPPQIAKKAVQTILVRMGREGEKE